jgi:hypothetical protein
MEQGRETTLGRIKEYVHKWQSINKSGMPVPTAMNTGAYEVGKAFMLKWYVSRHDFIHIARELGMPPPPTNKIKVSFGSVDVELEVDTQGILVRKQQGYDNIKYFKDRIATEPHLKEGAIEVEEEKEVSCRIESEHFFEGGINIKEGDDTLYSPMDNVLIFNIQNFSARLIGVPSGFSSFKEVTLKMDFEDIFINTSVFKVEAEKDYVVVRGENITGGIFNAREVLINYEV